MKTCFQTLCYYYVIGKSLRINYTLHKSLFKVLWGNYKKFWVRHHFMEYEPQERSYFCRVLWSFQLAYLWSRNLFLTEMHWGCILCNFISGTSDQSFTLGKIVENLPNFQALELEYVSQVPRKLFDIFLEFSFNGNLFDLQIIVLSQVWNASIVIKKYFPNW